MKVKIFILFIFLFASGLYSQEADISELLRAIETGHPEKAETALKKLQASNPGDPSVIYLDAVLTRDGKEALSKYEKVAESFPRSRYADASLYRIYSYYYASGLYNTAQKYYDKLEENYPSSFYLLQEKSSIEEDYDIQEDDKKIAETKDIINIPFSESKKEIPQPVKVYKYTIQTGAFLVESNARNLKNTFENAGYYSEVKEKKVGGSIFSIVFIGRFETEEEAKTFLIDLNKRQKIDGRIVHIE